jgi:epoxyqueuosine reductase
MEEEAHRLEAWLNNGSHGKMSYMERHFDKRVDPTKLVPGARSVISLTFNYFTHAIQEDPKSFKVSKYALGKDYHDVIKSRLKSLLESLKAFAGDVYGRCFVDSAPVLERDWAKRAGVGWIGKNTLLLNKNHGSYFFLAELIIDLELDYDSPGNDYCGTCTRCIDACPTQAISPAGYILEADKCISYLTIELRDSIPEEFKGQFEDWIFGCDICQDVCPWNRFSVPHAHEDFTPDERLLTMSRRDWIELTEDTFNQVFHKSAVKRTKFEGLKRNIAFVSKT